MKRRVVITGIGAVTPLGNTMKDTWSALCEGVSGIAHITRFDASYFPSMIAGEIKGFSAGLFITKKGLRRLDPFIHYATASALMAVEDSEVRFESTEKERYGVVIGSSRGGILSTEASYNQYLHKGPHGITPFYTPMSTIGMAAGYIAIRLRINGPSLGISTACSSGTHAIGEAYRMIQRGEVELVFTGGTEASISPLILGGYAAAKVLSTRNNEPQKASRPFDRHRDGFVLSEGACILVLEEMQHALQRNARIYAEIIGYGSSTDAYHQTDLPPDGSGAVMAMRKALMDANISPSEIDYINAHGTSTLQNDRVETLAIKTVFNKDAFKIPVSSIKSMTGHMLAASGALEVGATAMSIYEGIIPPTINYEMPDSECDLDYVPNTTRRQQIEIALTNSFGFGGMNAVIVLRKSV
ncbi:MAG: beta-ketoacyl-ACP synthase II [Nitrospirota bacterium]